MQPESQAESQAEGSANGEETSEDAAVQMAEVTAAEDTVNQDQSAEPSVVARESFVAHLSSVRSKESTESEWQSLQSIFPQLLSDVDFTVRSIEIAEQGTFYRVMAGPFEARIQAESLCAELEPQDQYCQVYELTNE